VQTTELAWLDSRPSRFRPAMFLRFQTQAKVSGGRPAGGPRTCGTPSSATQSGPVRRKAAQCDAKRPSATEAAQCDAKRPSATQSGPVRRIAARNLTSRAKHISLAGRLSPPPNGGPVPRKVPSAILLRAGELDRRTVGDPQQREIILRAQSIFLARDGGPRPQRRPSATQGGARILLRAQSIFLARDGDRAPNGGSV